MPDATPKPIRFERALTLDADVRAFACDETTDVDPAGTQRAVSVTSLAVGDGTNVAGSVVFAPEPIALAPGTTRDVAGNALGYYDPLTHDLALIAWRTGTIERAQILEKNFSIVARLTLVPGKTAHSLYAYESAETPEGARARLQQLAARANAP
jgi:hypothetical protein